MSDDQPVAEFTFVSLGGPVKWLLSKTEAPAKKLFLGSDDLVEHRLVARMDERGNFDSVVVCHPGDSLFVDLRTGGVYLR